MYRARRIAVSMPVFAGSPLILIAFRHGLRPVEAVGLRWDAIDFDRGEIHIARVKRGSAATHPLAGRELRALRRLDVNTNDDLGSCSRWTLRKSGDDPLGEEDSAL